MSWLIYIHLPSRFLDIYLDLCVGYSYHKFRIHDELSQTSLWECVCHFIAPIFPMSRGPEQFHSLFLSKAVKHIVTFESKLRFYRYTLWSCKDCSIFHAYMHFLVTSLSYSKSSGGYMPVIPACIIVGNLLRGIIIPLPPLRLYTPTSSFLNLAVYSMSPLRCNLARLFSQSSQLEKLTFYFLSENKVWGVLTESISRTSFKLPRTSLFHKFSSVLWRSAHLYCSVKIPYQKVILEQCFVSILPPSYST